MVRKDRLLRLGTPVIGKKRNYVLLMEKSKYVADIPNRIVKVPKLYRVALGEKTIEVKELCIIFGKIEGLDFDAEAVCVDKIGKADGYELDAIIGALTIEKWKIKLAPKSGELDLEGLRRREFTEFYDLMYN